MLTHDQILALPVGKHINAAIAEYVLGYIWLHNKRYGFLLAIDEAKVVVEAGFANYGKHPEHEAGAWIGPPETYSTGIAYAWQIVEKMHADGWGWGMSAGRATIVPLPGHRLPDCTFYTRDGSQGWNQSDTAPLAICRAALLAKLAAASSIQKEASR